MLYDARFGFAISPGLDVTYEAPADRAAIMAKLAPLLLQPATRSVT
jgi:hypothetical protein